MQQQELPTPAGLPHVHAPAPGALRVLYRVRRDAFREQSRSLYRRYGQVLLVLGSLFGLLLVERPALVAAPLLHFRDAPGIWWRDLAHALLWMAVVAAWSGVHRGFVRGGAFARYARSLALPAGGARLVDLSMLALSLRVFLLPFAVALWFTLGEPEPAGRDGRFWLYGALLAGATPACAWGVTFGRGIGAWRVPGALLAALAWLPQLADTWSAASLAALSAALLAACTLPLPGWRPWRLRGTRGGGAVRSPRFGIPSLARLQCALLFHRHRFDAAMRLFLAALPQLGAWWMIVWAGKTDEGPALLQLACAATACLTSGYVYTLDRASGGMRGFLRSMPSGELRLALAAQLLCCSVTLPLFGATWLALAWSFGPGDAVAYAMLRAGGCWLAMLLLLGQPLIARHRHGIVFKFALATAALFIVFS